LNVYFPEGFVPERKYPFKGFNALEGAEQAFH